MARSPSTGGAQPLVVSLNCLDDPSPEQDGLAGVAAVEHVPLSAAAAVLLPSLAFLPRAALVTMKGLLPALLSRNYPDKLNEGFVVALRARDNSGYHVARQRVAGGGGWILDVVSNATNRDPAAQFLVTFKNKNTMGLRSFVAGGKLLQINRKTEFVFASHSFEVWESWMLEGSLLEGCKLINCRNPSAVLDVCIEILAAASDGDGVTRWLD